MNIKPCWIWKKCTIIDSAYKSECMGTIRNMLHKWKNTSQLGKCFMIGKMLLVLLGFINLQILEFHSYVVPVYPYTRSNIIANDNHKIAWPFFFFQIHQAMVLIQRGGMVDTHTYNAKINLVSNAKLVHKSFTKFLNVYAYMYMQSLSEKIVECLKMEILTNISKEGAGNRCFNQAHWLQFHLSVLLRLAIKLMMALS